MCPITINKALLLQEGILRFELSWTAVAFDNDIIQIIYDKPVVDLKNNRSCIGLRRKIINRDIPSLFELFYIVRCNLFHGCKMPDNPRDKQLTEACALLLEGYLKVYFDNVEHDSEIKSNNIN